MYSKQLGRGYVITNLDTLNDLFLSQFVVQKWDMKKAGPV